MPRTTLSLSPALGDGAGGVGVVPAELVLSEAGELGSVDQHIRHRHILLRVLAVSSAPAFRLLRWSYRRGMPLVGPLKWRWPSRLDCQ